MLKLERMEAEIRRIRNKLTEATSWGADTTIDGIPALVSGTSTKLLAEKIPGTYYAQAYVKTETTGGNKTTESSLAVDTPNNNAIVLRLLLSEDDGTGAVVDRYIDVNAPFKLDALTSDPASGPDGLIWYNSTDDKFRGFLNGAEVDFVTGNGGAMKVINGGYYLIPAGPGLGTTVTSSASADTYGSWTEMRSASGNALYIVGISVSPNGSAGYTQIDIGTGGAGAETSISETIVRGTAAETKPFLYPIAVAANTRIACRVADEDASAQDARVYLLVVDQADVASL